MDVQQGLSLAASVQRKVTSQKFAEAKMQIKHYMM